MEDTSTPELQSFALRKLMSPYDSKTLVGPIAVVDVFWAEIADSIGAMEVDEDPAEAAVKAQTSFVDLRYVICF